MTKRKLPPDDQVIAMYESGMSTGEIAERCGVTPATVFGLFRRIGFRTRSVSESARLREQRGRSKKGVKRRCRPILDRLMSKVIVDENGCWIWQGTKNPAGYGTIGIGRAAEGKGFVHRVIYELMIGPIPEGQCVCHKCDVRLCVNPLHLFSGTYLDNAQDAKAKGRLRTGEDWWTENRMSGGICKGERHGHAKLTATKVQSIRKDFATGQYTKAALARRHKMSRAMIRLIVNRKNWNHI